MAEAELTNRCSPSDPTSEVDVIARAVVAAVQPYSKINAAGQWIDRTEQVSLNDLFDRMSNRGLEDYARDGTLPAWFETGALGATQEDSLGR